MYQVRGKSISRLFLSGLFAFGFLFLVARPIEAAKATTYTEAYDRNLGAFRVVVADVGSEYSNLSVAVWSEVNGQDDLFWYTPKQRDDGAWYVNVLMTDHRTDFGKYYADTWATDKEGNRVYLCGTQQITEGVSKETYTVRDVNNDQSVFRAGASGVICQGMTNVEIAVWSDKNWQDDLKWYAGTVSNKSFAVNVPVENHKDSGKYYADAYLRDKNGKRVFLGSATFQVSKATAGSVKIVRQNNDNGTFRVVVGGVKAPGGVSKVEIPTWCDPKQKDIKWYVAKKDSSGNWYADVNISGHQYNLGKYISHVYVSSKNGARDYVGKTEANVSISKKNYTAKDKDGKQTTFQVNATEVIPQGMVNAEVAVWSDEKGQDDLKWYPAKVTTGKISVDIPIKNHKSAGKYYADTYLKDGNGKKHFLASTSFTVSKATASGVKITNQNNNNGTFRVVVTGVKAPSGVSKVEIPTWSDPNQKDIKWYVAKKDSSGNWYADVNISNHKYNLGKYISHVYVTGGNGAKNYVGKTDAKVNISKKTYTAKDVNGKQVNFKIEGTGLVRQGMTKAQIAVWSVDKGQDDLIWYDATLSGDAISLTVDINRHRSAGKYYADAYLIDGAGGKHFLASTNFTTSVQPVAIAEQLYKAIDQAVAGRQLIGFGGYTPSPAMREEIVSAIRWFQDRDIPMGFVMVDIQSKQGIAYNPDVELWSASTIKGPYIVSVVQSDNSKLAIEESRIRPVLRYSDNNYYHQLVNYYGPGVFNRWTNSTGTGIAINDHSHYTWYTPRKLAKMWAKMYDFFETNATGESLGKMFESPTPSPIHEQLAGGGVRTRTKPGWYSGSGSNMDVANDAGIIYDNGRPYLLAVMTRGQANLNIIKPLAKVLHRAHQEMGF